MRLILVLEVEPIGNEVFREWPLHCTLVHWFDYEGDVEILFSNLTDLYKNIPPVELKGSERAMFGANQNLEVNLVDITEAVQSLHQSSINKLRELGAKFTAENYLLDGYRPHVTVHGGRRLALGDTHLSKGIYLVQSVNEKPKERKVLRKFILAGEL